MSRTNEWGDLLPEVDRDEDQGYSGPDPHNIIPPSFKFQSIHDAAREADRSDDIREDPRCPSCLSPNIGGKPGAATDAPSHKIDAAYRCRSCGEHFDEREAPAIEMPTCGGCGRQLGVRRLGAGTFRCQRCERDWQTLSGVRE